MKRSILLPILFLLLSIVAYPQSFQWGRTGSGGIQNRGYAVAADSSGYIYVAGSFESGGGTATDFSGVRPVAFGGADVFLAKYDNNGRLIWIRTGGSSDYDAGWDVCVDSSGNIYLAALLRKGFYDFDTNGFESVDRDRIVIAKYNPYGGLLWLVDDTTAVGSVDPRIACNPNGGIYLTGHWSATTRFFIASYDDAGTERWRRQVESRGRSYCGGIAIAPDGGFCITGAADGITRLDTIEVGSAGNPYPDMFIARYNAEGRVVWARSERRDHLTGASAIGADAAGNFYIAGTVLPTTVPFDSGFISKYDAVGTQLWTKAVDVGMHNLAVTPSGTLYLTGTNSASTRVHVASYTSDGDPGWKKEATGHVAIGFDVTYDRNNNVFVTGSFGTNNVLPPVLYLDNIELHGNASTNMFIAEISGTSDVESRETSVAAGVRLHHVAPNPSTGAAAVRFEIREASSAKLALYNARGEEIAVMMERKIAEGYHDIVLDLHDLPDGIYILRLSAGRSSHSVRLVLVK